MKLFKHKRATRSRFAAPPAIGLFLLAILATLSFAGSALSAQPTVILGNADSFGALSFAAMTNAGAPTVVHGDIGSSTSIDAGVTHPGFGAYGPGTPELANAQASLLTAYNFAEAQAPTQSITGANLGGDTLLPGVYNSTGGILIDDPLPLTLDGNGDSSSVFIFQAASSGNLIVESTSSIVYTNGAQPCNVFWKVNSAFLRNTNFTFIGTILALTQITLTENITVEGRVLARNADVTFIHDTINKPTCVTPSPTPGGGGSGPGGTEGSQQRSDWQQTIVAPNGTPLPPEGDAGGAADPAEAEAEAAREHVWSNRLNIAGRITIRITLLAAIVMLSATWTGGAPATALRPTAVKPSQELAALRFSHKVFSKPSKGAARLALVSSRRPITEERTVLPVLGHRTSRDGLRWLQVRLPGRPNGRTGWISRRGTVAWRTKWHLVVSTSSRRVTVYERGRRARVFSAIVGHVSTPTPAGAFFVEESIQMPRSAPGAPFALALSGRSNVLQEFAGGPGQIALHGLSNVGGTLGTAVSHGCVRLGNGAMRWLVARIGPGTPVTITR